jgi:hypothetical protein
MIEISIFFYLKTLPESFRPVAELAECQPLNATTKPARNTQASSHAAKNVAKILPLYVQKANVLVQLSDGLKTVRVGKLYYS